MMQSHAERPSLRHRRPLGARRDAGGAAARSTRRPGRRAGCNSAPPSATCWSTRRPTTPRRSSSATRSARSSRTRRRPRSCADIDHPFAAKRPPIDTDYFETFNRDNVALVDMRADADRGDHAGRHPHARRREYELDIIVFATGFDAMTGPLLRMDIRGRDGLRAARRLGGRAAHLSRPAGRGLPEPVHDHRPGQPVGAVQHAGRDRAARRVDRRLHRPHARARASRGSRPTRRRWTSWVEHVNEAANATLLPQADHSWYLGANVPGKPRVFMPYAGGMARYREICDDVAAKGYEGFALSK